MLLLESQPNGPNSDPLSSEFTAGQPRLSNSFVPDKSYVASASIERTLTSSSEFDMAQAMVKILSQIENPFVLKVQSWTANPLNLNIKIERSYLKNDHFRPINEPFRFLYSALSAVDVLPAVLLANLNLSPKLLVFDVASDRFMLAMDPIPHRNLNKVLRDRWRKDLPIWVSARVLGLLDEFSNQSPVLIQEQDACAAIALILLSDAVGEEHLVRLYDKVTYEYDTGVLQELFEQAKAAHPASSSALDFVFQMVLPLQPPHRTLYSISKLLTLLQAYAPIASLPTAVSVPAKQPSATPKRPSEGPNQAEQRNSKLEPRHSLNDATGLRDSFGNFRQQHESFGSSNQNSHYDDPLNKYLADNGDSFNAPNGSNPMLTNFNEEAKNGQIDFLQSDHQVYIAESIANLLRVKPPSETQSEKDHSGEVYEYEMRPKTKTEVKQRPPELRLEARSMTLQTDYDAFKKKEGKHNRAGRGSKQGEMNLSFDSMELPQETPGMNHRRDSYEEPPIESIIDFDRQFDESEDLSPGKVSNIALTPYKFPVTGSIELDFKDPEQPNSLDFMREANASPKSNDNAEVNFDIVGPTEEDLQESVRSIQSLIAITNEAMTPAAVEGSLQNEQAEVYIDSPLAVVNLKDARDSKEQEFEKMSRLRPTNQAEHWRESIEKTGVIYEAEAGNFDVNSPICDLPENGALKTQKVIKNAQTQQNLGIEDQKAFFLTAKPIKEPREEAAMSEEPALQQPLETHGIYVTSKPFTQYEDSGRAEGLFTFASPPAYDPDGQSETFSTSKGIFKEDLTLKESGPASQKITARFSSNKELEQYHQTKLRSENFSFAKLEPHNDSTFMADILLTKEHQAPILEEKEDAGSKTGGTEQDGSPKLSKDKNLRSEQLQDKNGFCPNTIDVQKITAVTKSPESAKLILPAAEPEKPQRVSLPTGLGDIAEKLKKFSEETQNTSDVTQNTKRQSESKESNESSAPGVNNIISNRDSLCSNSVPKRPFSTSPDKPSNSPQLSKQSLELLNRAAKDESSQQLPLQQESVSLPTSSKEVVNSQLSARTSEIKAQLSKPLSKTDLHDDCDLKQLQQQPNLSETFASSQNDQNKTLYQSQGYFLSSRSPPPVARLPPSQNTKEASVVFINAKMDYSENLINSVRSNSRIVQTDKVVVSKPRIDHQFLQQSPHLVNGAIRLQTVNSPYLQTQKGVSEPQRSLSPLPQILKNVSNSAAGSHVSGLNSNQNVVFICGKPAVFVRYENGQPVYRYFEK